MNFQDYLNGDGCTVIAKKLRELNVKKLRGGKWNSERVADIIKNEKYTGNALLQKKYVKDHLTKKLIKNKGMVPQYYAEETHPAIIDIELFERAQEIMRINRIKFKCEPGKKSYIFTSKIECGICGKNYKHKNRSGRITWVCSKHDKYGNEGCSAKPIYEDVIIKSLNEVLEMRNFNESKFNQEVDKIKIEKDRRIVFLLKNGKIIEKGKI